LDSPYVYRNVKLRKEFVINRFKTLSSLDAAAHAAILKKLLGLMIRGRGEAIGKGERLNPVIPSLKGK
jgi:hypothetical protein